MVYHVVWANTMAKITMVYHGFFGMVMPWHKHFTRWYTTLIIYHGTPCGDFGYDHGIPYGITIPKKPRGIPWYFFIWAEPSVQYGYKRREGESVIQIAKLGRIWDRIWTPCQKSQRMTSKCETDYIHLVFRLFAHIAPRWVTSATSENGFRELKWQRL